MNETEAQCKMADPSPMHRAAALPSFYLVGDSISIDYHDALERECRGHYRYSRKGGLALARSNLDHPQGANGGDSAAVLDHLRTILREPAAVPGTIIVNCGLHDIKTDPKSEARQVPLETYHRNLVAIVDLVQGAGKRLVWITTTPLDEHRHNARSSSFHRFESDLADYNIAASEIMAERGVPIINLHGFTAQINPPLFRDHVHFLPEVSVLQAGFLRAVLDGLAWPPETLTE